MTLLVHEQALAYHVLRLLLYILSVRLLVILVVFALVQLVFVIDRAQDQDLPIVVLLFYVHIPIMLGTCEILRCLIGGRDLTPNGLVRIVSTLLTL